MREKVELIFGIWTGIFLLVELRRFFTSGVDTNGGDQVSVVTVLRRLGELVKDEDMEKPLSDDRLADELKKLGYPIARRTVAKYRGRLGIPTAAKRTVKPK